MQILFFTLITLTAVHAVKYGVLTPDDVTKLWNALVEHPNIHEIEGASFVMLLTKELLEVSKEVIFGVGLYNVGDKSFTVEFVEVNANADTSSTPRSRIKASGRGPLVDMATADLQVQEKISSVKGSGEIWVLTSNVLNPNVFRGYLIEEQLRQPPLMALSTILAVKQGFISKESLQELTKAISSNQHETFKHIQEKKFHLVKMYTKDRAVVLLALYKMDDSEQYFNVRFDLVTVGGGSSRNQPRSLQASDPTALMNKEAAEGDLATKFTQCVVEGGGAVILTPQDEKSNQDFHPIPTPASLGEPSTTTAETSRIEQPQAQESRTDESRPPSQTLENGLPVPDQEAERPPVEGIENQTVVVNSSGEEEEPVTRRHFVTLRQACSLKKVCIGILCCVGTLSVPTGLAIGVVYAVNPGLLGLH